MAKWIYKANGHPESQAQSFPKKARIAAARTNSPPTMALVAEIYAITPVLAPSSVGNFPSFIP